MIDGYLTNEKTDKSIKFCSNNICFAFGNGIKLVDVKNNEYLDFCNETNLIGYNANPPATINAVSPPFYTPQQEQLYNELVSKSNLDRAYLCDCASEAIDYATKLASARGGEIIKSGFCENDTAFNCGKTLKQQFESRNIGAFMLKLISENGQIAAYDYVLTAYALCRERGALFMVDESLSIGRLGALFAFDTYGIQPDIITLGSALGGGVAIGACIYKDELAKSGSVFGCTAIGAAAACNVLDTLKNGTQENAVRVGEHLSAALCRLNKYKFCRIDGKGLFYTITLSPPLSAKELCGKLAKQGILVSEKNGFVKIAPPLCVTKAQADTLCNALEAMFAKTNV